MLVDVSHTVREGVVTYKGLPPPIICDFLSRRESRAHYAPGTEFQIGKVEMVANTGTYVDSPFHRFADGDDVSSLPLESVADLEGVVVEVPEGTGRRISEDAFRGIDVEGKAVLVRTGWDRHWDTDAYMEGHPFLTREAARWLADSGAKLVGIDSLNIDDTEDGERPVHTTLLNRGIPIVEHLQGLEALRDRSFRFFAVPVKVERMGSFPVRAFGRVIPTPLAATP